jgi:glutathione-regulated potassium-efflux system ancillary protein KefF
MLEARKVLVLYAHPYPRRSRAGKALLAAVADLPFVGVRSLYDLYPDFAIDVAAEQAALLEAEIIVWQSPFYWYGVPSLLSHWFEKVLLLGWAYGSEGKALVGKKVQWVTTTGAPQEAYGPGQAHGHPFSAFVPAVEQTARFCGMDWLEPLVVQGAHRLGPQELAAHTAAYRSRLIDAACHKEELDGRE